MNDIQERRKAFLVNVFKDKEDIDVLDELELLAQTADYEVVGRLTQRKDKPNKSFYLSKEKKKKQKRDVNE